MLFAPKAASVCRVLMLAVIFIAIRESSKLQNST
jgi:hypothetical protein